MIIGLVGNVIVVAVITTLRKRGQKASMQLFFLHLAISDLMVCLLCIPLTIFTNFNYPNEFYERDVGLCKISRFMQVLDLPLCTIQFEISNYPPPPPYHHHHHHHHHPSPKTHDKLSSTLAPTTHAGSETLLGTGQKYSISQPQRPPLPSPTSSGAVQFAIMLICRPLSVVDNRRKQPTFGKATNIWFPRE